MFFVIRMIICLLLLLGLDFMFRKSKAIHRNLLRISAAFIAVLLFVVLSFCPFENLLVTFDSPEAVYKYRCLGESDIELVVEGDGCAFVVDQKTDADEYLFIPRSKTGWKIGSDFGQKVVAQKVVDNNAICVYKCKHTKDHFITIINTDGATLEITDSTNSAFYSLERKNKTDQKTYTTYYAYIPRFDAQYSVTIDGNTITIE